MKKKISSFEIIENSFGGSFPSCVKLETQPDLTVNILEDTFTQDIIKLLSCKDAIRNIYKHQQNTDNTLKVDHQRLLEETSETKLGTKLANFLYKSALPAIVHVFLFVKFIPIIFKPDDFELLAHVSPIMKNNIYLKSKVIQESGRDIDQVISHENIHVLQYQGGSFDIAKAVKDKERVDTYIKHYLNDGTKKRHRYFQYIFSKVEIEARVNELVCAFYISTTRMPLSQKDFLVCLIFSNDILDFLNSSKQFGASMPQNILNLLDEIKEHAAVMSITSPIVTPTPVTLDFKLILMAFNDPEELFKFISFELPSYYCNVLKLYGSESVSSKIQNEINQERELFGL